MIEKARRQMKEYKPEKLVAISRYQNFFPTLPENNQSDVYARMEELLPCKTKEGKNAGD
jgi:hypothetical protein